MSDELSGVVVQNHSSIVRTERIAGRGILGAFAGLLSLTSDAVLVFGASKLVLIANEAAETLFNLAPGALPGMDVRDLVLPSDGIRPADDEDWLPLALDGTSIAKVRRPGSMGEMDVVLRCTGVSGSDGAYMVVMRTLDEDASFALERDRMVTELTQANRRLVGTLKIVLDTLGANDLDELLEHVVRELRDVCGATDVLAYVSDSGALRLMSKTGSISTSALPVRIPFNSGLARIAQISGTAQRLRFDGSELENEGTHETYRISSAQVPPFPNMMLVPVWFGRSMIAAILVGWTVPRHTTTEDARLLDAVCQYLSAQIAGALSALRARRADELDHIAQDLHDRLAASEDVSGTWRRELSDCVSRALFAHTCHIRVDEKSGETLVELPDAGEMSIPLSQELVDYKPAVPDEGLVLPIVKGDALSGWLERFSAYSYGALMVSDEVGGERGACLVLRDDEMGPLSDAELDFLRRVSAESTLVARGVIARGEDRRISQALQLGMRNELQQVEGITAEGVYSSATAAAFVGGDFYDLIRLPDRRACVIMGDVSGKGVEAASVSAAVRTALGAYAWVGLSPAAMVRSLNNFLLGFSRIETFATLFVGIVDLDAAELVYCSAGHPPAILVTNGCELTTLDVRSGLVGAFASTSFVDGRVELHPDDTLLLYTDGVTEARNPSGAFLGEDGLREAVLRESSTQGTTSLVNGLLRYLDGFTGNNLDDDVAMVSLRFDGLA